MRRDGSLAIPYLIGLGLLVAIPAAAAITLSFTEFTGVQPPRFNGLGNFTRLLDDGAFWRAFGNSLAYVAIAVPLRLVVAVTAALILQRRVPGASIGRVSAYAPTVVPDVAWALLWLWLLNPLFGPLAALWATFGLGEPGTLTDPWAARVSIAVMGGFQIGEAFVIALAARRSIPEHLYESAAVDGAKPWFTLRNVTLPLMLPIMVLLALRDVILSFQINFVPALIVTDGGPRYATTYVPLYLYRAAVRYFRFGYASAMSVTLFVLTGLALWMQYRLARRWRLL
ncbi:MAG: sugar ABC transporter permease [Actinomycetota bacterium]|nr:sugar ABC transporter permease [Actinomycetota bacterium]